MPTDQMIDGLIRMTRENLIARTNLTSDLMVGELVVHVENSFRYQDGDEIIVIDNNYNNPDGTNQEHYQAYEYLTIKEVNNTTAITLDAPPLSNWLVSDGSLIQRTIAHSPLFEENVLYGDREVINSEEVTITVEPESYSNEWIWLQGGLSEEYRVNFMVYAKDSQTEPGMKIISKYADALTILLLQNIHIDLTDYFSPLIQDVTAGDDYVVVENTAENREMFVVNPDDWSYWLQDNLKASIRFKLENVVENGSELYLYFTPPICEDFYTSEFAAIRKVRRYIYDSRVDGVTYGSIQKGSSLMKAARLSWFGKETAEYVFPQPSKGIDSFQRVDPVINESSSSSSS